jgi:NAD(P)-dependent dehydrogenase (short-subunit alcohol dehydrogenase family)
VTLNSEVSLCQRRASRKLAHHVRLQAACGKKRRLNGKRLKSISPVHTWVDEHRTAVSPRRLTILARGHLHITARQCGHKHAESLEADHLIVGCRYVRHRSSIRHLLTKYLFHRRVQSLPQSISRGDLESVIDFAGQVVIVTGAGRGLGRLYAIELAKRGASVVVNDLGGSMHGSGADASVADEVVAEIERAGGVAVASHDSVDSPEGGQAIVAAAAENFGRLDAVVSNAGIFNSSPFEELSADDWRRMLGVHLDGAFYLSQPAYRVMKSQGYGRFVFVSSSGGMFGQPLEAHYAAAKAGLVGLTNVIAIEGAEHGIRANTVLPFGFSRMVTETVGDPKALEETGFLKVIKPELVVPMVVFLASRSCEFSHHNYSACAGRFARVFVGLGEGWLADAESDPTADDIAAHLSEISATEPFTVPGSIVEEVFAVCERLGIAPF